MSLFLAVHAGTDAIQRTPEAPMAESVADSIVFHPGKAVSLEGENPSEIERVCSGCGLTEAEFQRTGLLGCARCYERFAPTIAQAVERLHGVVLPKSFTEPVVARRVITNPWPTRRGIRL